MLLPSDVARLVLGYLQQEKLSSTCKAFIAESSHLKEYADHHTEDGAVPGCLLSLFGKNLTTILNEYITMKAKENQTEVPFMMSSLWKKLELTLSQIRCMQESSAFQTNQRARTRKGINDRLRQKMLTSPAASCSPVSQPVTQQISTPLVATQYILCPISTPSTSQSVSNVTTTVQPSVPSKNPSASSSLQTALHVAAAPSQKKPSITATSSPVRRKPETQRRRRTPPSTTTPTEKDQTLDIDTIEGLINEDFPQLVIENAREKFLSNRSLQEKLAENINKILGSDTTSQTSKQSDGTAAEQDASIDEILGLQGGEIHMTEEAIHDILVQTELDPDFQELYDLFHCASSKTPKGSSRDSSFSSQSLDKTTGSEKSENQDVVEEDDSRERAGNKQNECPGERETNAAMLDNHSDAKEKTGGSLQQTCVNESAASGSPKLHRRSSDIVISIECSDGDPAMESSNESNGTVLEVSYTEPQEVEMVNVSSTHEDPDDSCFVVNNVPQASVSAKKSERINVCSKGSQNEEPTGMSTGEGTTNQKLLDKPQKESNGNLVASQPSTNDAHGSILLIPASGQGLNCSNAQNEKDHPPAETSKIRTLNKLCDDAKDKQGNGNDCEVSVVKDVAVLNSTVNAVLPEATQEQNNLGPEISSQADIDPSTIVTLDIITEDIPDEAELNNAVRSIHEESYPTIILSPLVKNPETRRVASSQNSSLGDLTESSMVGEQCPGLATSSESSVNTINIPNGDCAVYAVSGASNSTDGSVLQLIPTSSSTFAPTNSLFISSCVTSNVPAKQPNIMMLSNSSAPNNSQKQAALFQTPPRPGSVYTVGQAISPKLSQGSTIILASPVQPMLQGVMSMFPVSLVGQSGSTFTAQPHQILHVPVSKPMVPKLPLPPKCQKTLPKPAANTGKLLSNATADSVSRPTILLQRENEEKNSTSMTQQPKPDERSLSETSSAVSKTVEAHRRVLCFDGASSSLTTNAKKDKNDSIRNALASTEPVSSKITLPKEAKKIEGSLTSLGKVTRVDVSVAQGKDQPAEKKTASEVGVFGVNKENVLQGGAHTPPTGQIDKKSASQESLHTEKNSKTPQESVRKQTSLPNILRRTPQKMPSERVCSPSPLAKQASQLLQDMQFHSPTTKLRTTLDVPRTPGSGLEVKSAESNSDHARTPTCRRYNEDGGTPKPMMPPATPDMPTCSPASEAGSENSVNMAAHTLMILSRASISKASTPLKDNTHQPKPSKSSAKKRRLEDSEEYERRSHRKELLSPSSLTKKKKMKKQRKKSSDNFPAGMDVDKFLMSLYYDE